MRKDREENPALRNIDSADMLSAGIYFDKENAWGKLQGRLDGRIDGKKIMFHWLGIAASLILFMCVINLFFSAKKTTTTHTAFVPVMKLETTGPKTKDLPKPLLVKAPIARIKYKSRKDENKPAIITVAKTQTTIKHDEPAQPRIAAVQKMKVVHINEVIKQEDEIKEIMQGDRFSMGRKLLFRPAENETDPHEYNGEPSTGKFFKIKFN